MLYIFVSNTLLVGQINSKDFRRVMMVVSQKEQASKDFENKIIDRTYSKCFTSITYIFHFWIGSQSVGITITIQFFQVQLDWSCWNLSLLSLVLCAWPSLCASVLVFCSFFKLDFCSMLNENFFVTCKVKRWRKLEIVAVSFSSAVSLLSLNACTQMYNVFTK